MADAKISELPEITSAPANSWLVVVVMNSNGGYVTSKIRPSNLVP